MYFTFIILGYAFWNPYKIPGFDGFNSIFLIIGSIMLTLLYFSIHSTIKHIKYIDDSKIVIISFFLLVLFQIIYLLNIQGISETDLSFIHEEAVAMLVEKRTISKEYFGNYPYLVFYLLIIYYLFKLARLFHITDLNMVGYIFNILLIDGSVLLTYLTVRMKSEKNYSLTIIPFFILSPIIYIYISFYYTDILAMFCTSAILYLFFKLEICQTKISRVIYLFLLTIISLLGFKVRATVGIPIIGICFWKLFKCRNTPIKKISLKTTGVYSMCVLISGVLFLGGYRFIESKFVTFDYSQSRFPIEHWIGMGVSEPMGGYNTSDVNEMIESPTFSEKRKLSLTKIKKRLQERSLDENIIFGSKKLSATWSSGLAWNHRFTRITRNYNTLWNYLFGDKKILFFHLAQIILCSIWGITILGNINKKNSDLIDISEIILVGAMVFYLLWEGKTRYIVSFYSVIIILMNECVPSIFNQIVKLSYIFPSSLILKKYIKVSMVIILISGLFFHAKYVKYPIPIKYYSVNQNVENSTIILDNQTKITQSFKGQNDINNIAIKIEKGEYHKDTKLYMYLYDSNNQLIISEVKAIKAENHQKDRFLIWNLKKPIQAQNQYFTLLIKAKVPSEGIPISLIYANSKYYNFYENGQLKLNGQKQDGNLTMSIYNEVVSPFMSEAKYNILVVLILFVNFYIIYELYRNLKENEVQKQ